VSFLERDCVHGLEGSQVGLEIVIDKVQYRMVQVKEYQEARLQAWVCAGGRKPGGLTGGAAIPVFFPVDMKSRAQAWVLVGMLSVIAVR
jgi:hypothetical protein